MQTSSNAVQKHLHRGIKIMLNIYWYSTCNVTNVLFSYKNLSLYQYGQSYLKQNCFSSISASFNLKLDQALIKDYGAWPIRNWNSLPPPFPSVCWISVFPYQSSTTLQKKSAKCLPTPLQLLLLIQVIDCKKTHSNLFIFRTVSSSL